MKTDLDSSPVVWMGNTPTTKKVTYLTDNRKNSHPLLVKSEPHGNFVIFLVCFETVS